MYINTLEDSPTHLLREEVSRREAAFRDRKCWYCGKPLDIHSCLHRHEIDDEAFDWRRTHPEAVAGGVE